MDIKKAYYYLYYKIYNFGMALSDDFLREWKPLVIISLLQVFLLVQLLVWYTVLTRKGVTINNPKAIVIPIVSVISVANYIFFLHRNKWKNYIAEFKQYDKERGNLGGWIVLLLIVIVFGSLIFSFVKLSQIDWKAYR